MVVEGCPVVEAFVVVVGAVDVVVVGAAVDAAVLVVVGNVTVVVDGAVVAFVVVVAAVVVVGAVVVSTVVIRNFNCISTHTFLKKISLDSQLINLKVTKYLCTVFYPCLLHSPLGLY